MKQLWPKPSKGIGSWQYLLVGFGPPPPSEFIRECPSHPIFLFMDDPKWKVDNNDNKDNDEDNKNKDNNLLFDVLKKYLF